MLPKMSNHHLYLSWHLLHVQSRIWYFVILLHFPNYMDLVMKLIWYYVSA